jgi:hypothetical protein
MHVAALRRGKRILYLASGGIWGHLASALELVAHDCVYRYVRYQLLRTSEIRDNPHWQADSGGSEGSMCKRRMRSDQLCAHPNARIIVNGKLATIDNASSERIRVRD